MAQNNAPQSDDLKTVKVTVTVDANQIIHVKPDPVKVKTKDVLLTFELATPDYVFPTEGAVVVTNPGSQFPDPSTTLPSGTTATLLDLASEKSTFKYSVYVRDKSGKPLELDPTIENEPGPGMD